MGLGQALAGARRACVKTSDEGRGGWLDVHGSTPTSPGLGRAPEFGCVLNSAEETLCHMSGNQSYAFVPDTAASHSEGL